MEIMKIKFIIKIFVLCLLLVAIAATLIINFRPANMIVEKTISTAKHKISFKDFLIPDTPIRQTILPYFLNEDVLMFIGMRNASKPISSFIKSQFIGSLFNIQMTPDNEKILNSIRKELSGFSGSMGMTLNSQDFIDLIGNNMLIAFYPADKKKDERPTFVVMVQPRTQKGFRSIQFYVHDNAFPLTHENINCFVSNRTFIIFSHDTVIISNDFKRMLSTFKAFIMAKEDDASKRLFGEFAAKRFAEVYQKPESSFYMYFPIESIMGRSSNLNTPEIRKNIFFDRAFFIAHLNGEISVNTYLHIAETDNAHLNKVFTIPRKESGILKFIPDNSFFATISTSFYPSEWYADTKKMKRADMPSSIKNRLTLTNIAGIFDFLSERCFIEYERDLQNIIGSEIGVVLQDIDYQSKAEDDKGHLNWNCALILHPTNAAALTGLIEAKVKEVNEDFKRDIKFFIDEKVPPLFEPLKLQNRDIDTATVYSIDFSKIAFVNEFDKNYLEYATIDGYFLIGNKIEDLIKTYKGDIPSLLASNTYHRFSTIIGDKDGFGMFNFLNTSKCNKLFGGLAYKYFPHSAAKKAATEDEAKTAPEKVINIFGWLGNIMSESERKDDWIVSSVVFSLNDLPETDWFDIFQLFGAKEKPKL
jgi:hypothetical protein